MRLYGKLADAMIHRSHDEQARYRRIPKPPKPKEADIQRAILDYLATEGIFAYRSNTGAVPATYHGKSRFIRFGPKGQSDITAILPGGIYWAIEVKRPGGLPSETQWAFLDRVKQARAEWTVATSVDDVRRVVDSYRSK